MKNLDSKTKSLMRDFHALACKHDLQDVTLHLDRSHDNEMIRYAYGETWYHIAPVQWTPLKKTKDKSPIDPVIKSLCASFANVGKTEEQSVKDIQKKIKTAKKSI